ncbi:MAG: methyltransferase domain-containing protein [Pseudomonadota bacterium]
MSQALSLDVSDLLTFYGTPNAASVGEFARRLIVQRVRARWQDVRGLRVAGLGFAPPYLAGFRGEAERVSAFMPARQGSSHWPMGEPSLTALIDPLDWPVVDAMFDRVLLVHMLEEAQRPRLTLREAHRVMAPNARLMIVVPNRRGTWARFDTSPFGSGRPYSRGQLTRMLGETGFAPVSWSEALHWPPAVARLGAATTLAVERVGRFGWASFSGVIIVEAMKSDAPGLAALADEQAWSFRWREQLARQPVGATARGA